MKKAGIVILALLMLMPSIVFAAEADTGNGVEVIEEDIGNDEMDENISDETELQEPESRETQSDSQIVQEVSEVTISGIVTEGTEAASDKITVALYNIGTSDIYTVELLRENNYQTTISLPYGQYGITITPELDYDSIHMDSNNFEVLGSATNVTFSITGNAPEELEQMEQSTTETISDNQESDVETSIEGVQAQDSNTRSWLANNLFLLIIFAALVIAFFVVKKKKKQIYEE